MDPSAGLDPVDNLLPLSRIEPYFLGCPAHRPDIMYFDLRENLWREEYLYNGEVRYSSHGAGPIKLRRAGRTADATYGIRELHIRSDHWSVKFKGRQPLGKPTPVLKLL